MAVLKCSSYLVLLLLWLALPSPVTLLLPASTFSIVAIHYLPSSSRDIFSILPILPPLHRFPCRIHLGTTIEWPQVSLPLLVVLLASVICSCPAAACSTSAVASSNPAAQSTCILPRHSSIISCSSSPSYASLHSLNHLTNRSCNLLGRVLLNASPLSHFFLYLQWPNQSNLRSRYLSMSQNPKKRPLPL